MKLQALGAAVVVCLVGTASAQASTPALLGLSQQDRHPSATFAMPGADGGTIYLATAPDRATDGRFLDENVADLDFLTDDEIQSGHWLSSSQLDPGTYYGMVGADDYDCLGQPGCLHDQRPQTRHLTEDEVRVVRARSQGRVQARPDRPLTRGAGDQAAVDGRASTAPDSAARMRADSDGVRSWA